MKLNSVFFVAALIFNMNYSYAYLSAEGTPQSPQGDDYLPVNNILIDSNPSHKTPLDSGWGIEKDASDDDDGSLFDRNYEDNEFFKPGQIHSQLKK